MSSLDNSDEVFISKFGKKDKDGYRKLSITKAESYLRVSYHHFMNSKNDKETYDYFGKMYDIIKFNITNLQGDYPTLCIMVTKKQKKYFLSSNKIQLMNLFQLR